MILLLGASGYVGNAFQNFLHAKGLEFQTFSLKNTQGDKRSRLAETIRTIRPEFLISAAGFTGKPNVDAAEHQKLTCIEANITTPAIIAEVCADQGLAWGHVSSGCIFNGCRPDGTGFNEEDEPNFTFRQNNCSFYSGTKALAEEILADYPGHYLWRLRIPFNEVESPRNYLSKIMAYDRLLDVANSISQLDDFVRACYECWERRIPFGTYNVTNPGHVTTREVTEMLHANGFCRDKEFHFFDSEEEFMQLAAKTPRASCIMDSSKILSCGIELTEVHEAIDWCLKNWKSPVFPTAKTTQRLARR